MQEKMRKKAANHLVQKRIRRIRKPIVGILACAVVLSTTYSMILPALTLEEPPQCGKTEHTHSEECYTRTDAISRTVPVCTLESLNLHRHTDACLDEMGTYVCGYSDFVVHRHDSSCYGENGELWCTLPEIEAHTHSESCYGQPESVDPAAEGTDAGDLFSSGSDDAVFTDDVTEVFTEAAEVFTEGEPVSEQEDGSLEEPILICQIPEGEDGHIHEESCYETASQLDCTISEETVQQQEDGTPEEASEEPVDAETVFSQLSCGKEEIVLHTHSPECYDENETMICGMVQVQEHVHNENCFQTVEEVPATETLTCGLEEHIHSQECYKDLTDQVETPVVWEATLPESIPENWGEAVVAVAKSQVGYQESNRNYITDDQGEMKGYTRYGEWYGQPYGDWNAMFLAFCLNYAGIPAETFPREASVAQWVQTLQTEPWGLYRAKEGYLPKAGDLVFLDTDGDLTADSAALVAEVPGAEASTPTSVVIIEGDLEGSVQSVNCALNDGRILGYGELPEQDTPDAAETPDVEEIPDAAETPDVEEIPDAAETPETTETPDFTEAPDFTETSGMISATVLSEPDVTSLSLPHRESIERLQDGSEDYASTEDAVYFTPTEAAAEPASTEDSAEFTSEEGAAEPALTENAAEFTSGEDTGDFVSTDDGANYTAASEEAVSYGSDQYRLYLDVTGKSIPMDVLFVVDQSGADSSQTTSQNTLQETAQDLFYGENGLIADVLAQNAENQVAVCAFDTDMTDCSVLVDWTGESYSEDVTFAESPEEETVTKALSDMRQAVENDGRQKVMVYMNGDTAESGESLQEKMQDAFRSICDKTPAVTTYPDVTSDQESLRTQLQTMYAQRAAAITDQLSAYADVLNENPDYRVTMEGGDGSGAVLYENGSITASGTEILKEVGYDAGTKTVSALLHDGYMLQPGYTYTLSFNITATEQAYNEYSETGYSVTGGADTDHGAVQASSGQSGFYTDEASCVTYTVNGLQYSENYNKPVLQLSERLKEVSLFSGISLYNTENTNISLPHHKTIDAFRDQVDNPDTTVDNGVTKVSNLHRLYLDATPPKKNMPMDLVLVLDNSSSMFVLPTAKGIERNVAMNSAVSNFISEYFESNKGNRLSIVYFSGPAYIWNYGITAATTPNLTDDILQRHLGHIPQDAWSALQQDWTSDPATAQNALLTKSENVRINEEVYNITGTGAGTNYAAGLMKADEVLKTADPDHNVAMMFVSDGVPTHYIRRNEDGSLSRGGNGLSTENGSLDGSTNENNCKDPTKNAITDFQTAHPNLPMYSLSFWVKGQEGEADYDYALRAMPQNDGTYNHTDTADGLLDALEELIYLPVNNVTISDSLSENIDLYKIQPDYKVTMTRKSDGKTVALYDNGRITEEGKKVLGSVGYNEATRTVSAVFLPDYKLKAGYTYTLSYNIIASDIAHQKFADNPSYPDKGDSATDYGLNRTSSNKAGFHSNTEASVQYKLPDESEPIKELYKHPVIQLENETLRVKKKWFLGDTEITDGKTGDISFQLKREIYQVKPVTVPSGDSVQLTIRNQYVEEKGFLWNKWDEPHDNLVLNSTVDDGSDVTLTFKLTEVGKAGFKYLQIGKRIIEKEQLKQNGSTYTYTFRISGDTTVIIWGDQVQNGSCKATSSPHTLGNGLVYVGEDIFGGDKPITYTIGTNHGGWEKNITNLPSSGTTVNGEDVQYVYKVVELDNSAYKTEYENNDGVNNGMVTIKNTIMPELPETGGNGTIKYTSGGLLLALTAGMLLLYKKNKRRKEDFASS